MVSETDIETMCLSAIETYFEANKHVLEFMEICAEKKQLSLVTDCKEFFYHLISSGLRQKVNQSNKYCFYVEEMIYNTIDKLTESRFGPLIQKAKS